MKKPTPRHLIFAGIGAAALAVVGAGVWITRSTVPSWQTAHDPGIRVAIPKGTAPAPTKPWFRRQEGPPEFLTLEPDKTPVLMPHRDETGAGAQPPRPYEEALPETVHLTPPSDLEAAPIPRPSTGEAGILPPWREFAVHAPPADGRKQIAIVIDDAGIDRKRTARAIHLPGPLTIAFLTYAGALKRQTAEARAAGHELLVHMAMEPMSKAADPGPTVLRTDETPDEIRKTLLYGLSRFGGYVGINNHMGSRFTADEAGMTVALTILHERGLMFLDSRTTIHTVGAKVAHRLGVPLVERNVFLDNQPTPAYLARQLAELERTARHQGYAVAIGHPRDATLDALAAWLPETGRKGFQLVPISAIAARRMGISVAQSK